jgi:hypothetical protein
VRDQHFQDKFFERTSQRMAARFADRLLCVLDPFFPTPVGGGTSESIQGPLQAVFKLALDIKFESFGSNELLGLIWPAPGSTVPRSLVVTEQQSLWQVGPEPEDGDMLRVHIPLLPGIQQYGWKRELSNHRHFDTEGRIGLGEPVLVCPAVVASDA